MLTPAEATDVFPFDNSYARLPERLFARLPPTPVAAPRLIRLNEALARNLRLDPEMLVSAEGVAVLAGNRVPQSGEPLAMVYAGHQFGAFVPQLGDGRAILLGEVVDADGVRRDIQLKGSGSHPLLPQWRRPRRAWTCPAGVHCQRSDGRTWHSHHPVAGGCHRQLVLCREALPRIGNSAFVAARRSGHLSRASACAIQHGALPLGRGVRLEVGAARRHRASSCRIFTPAQPTESAASLRDYRSGVLI
jgi:Protein adenylyltransferase SelO